MLNETRKPKWHRTILDTRRSTLSCILMYSVQLCANSRDSLLEEMLSSWDTEHFPSISFVINTGAIAPGGLALNLYVGAALEMDILLGYCSAAAH